MASVSLRATIAPTSSTGAIGAVAAAAAGAPLTRGDTPALPYSQPLPTPSSQTATTAGETNAEGGAMRPDQANIARHLAYPSSDAQALAHSWRTMVRGHGSQLTSQALANSAGQLSPALLAAAAQGQVVRHTELTTHQDAWRFTIHVGNHTPQHLSVLSDDADPPGGRRKRVRAALRLELTLIDGTVIVLRVDPLPQGLAIALYTRHEKTLVWLKGLQSALGAALTSAALQVQRWQFHKMLPLPRTHAMIANAEAAAQMLTPAAFLAAAELALRIVEADAKRHPA